MKSTTSIKRNMYRVCIIAALGGLLFGLDQGFINGSLQYIAKEFHWTVLQGETFASIMIYGCIFGTIVSGWMARTIGRRQTLLLAALFFSFFTLVGAVTPYVSILYVCRFCIGLAVGCASFSVPLYLSEIAPTRYRGGFISMYQLMITIGIFMIYVSNTVVGKYLHSWRIMLLVITLPSVVMFLGVLSIPKTPRWLWLKGRDTEAREVLKKLRETDEEIQKEINEINESIDDGTKGQLWEIVSRPYFIKVLGLGICLQLLQQLSGINCVIYYSGEIFKGAGLSDPDIGTVIIGLVNVMTTILAVKYVDKWGRKPIINFGLVIMTTTLVIIGVIFHIKEAHHAVTAFEKVLMLSATILYIFAFAISLGPIIWVICAEIFPLQARDFGVAATTIVNWTGAAIVVQFSMTIMKVYGGSILFFLFALCCTLGFVLIGAFTPETKGTSLEEIEMNLKAGKNLRHIGDSR